MAAALQHCVLPAGLLRVSAHYQPQAKRVAQPVKALRGVGCSARKTSLASSFLGARVEAVSKSYSPFLKLSCRPYSEACATLSPPESPRVCEVADLETILSEHGACGVGVLARTDSQRTHKILQQALTALGCMEHRGGSCADNASGDGAGVMTAVPWRLLQAWARDKGLPPLNENNVGVGMVFLPRDDAKADAARKLINEVIAGEGIKVLGWRTVPVNNAVVGKMAAATQPKIEQVIMDVADEESTTGIKARERHLFLTRKLIEEKARAQPWGDDLYFCSFSNRSVVYKGMLQASALGNFYLDLKDEDFTTNWAIYHRRFSTNTNPKWPLAQPMRMLGHNGEINTLQGNLNWMSCRGESMRSEVWHGREQSLKPYADFAKSDSANLDNVAEILVKSGRPLEEALMILVPEAYRNHPTLDATYPEVIDFYEYMGGHMEAWDGPALLVFSDGETIGCALDRNGLRPARVWETSDGTLFIASEVGVIPMDEASIVSKSRLGPGMMISVHLDSGKILRNVDIKKEVASRANYKGWNAKYRSDMPDILLSRELMLSPSELLAAQSAFGYSSEDVQMIIESMGATGVEPTFCMGDDTPIAVLSERPHSLYDYFKQRFAQVTNPAIDPLREGLVMSLDIALGPRGNLLDLKPEDARQVHLKSPVLYETDVDWIMANPILKSSRLGLSYHRTGAGGSKGDLAKAVQALLAKVDAAVAEGTHCIVLSDREPRDLNTPCIPALLAVGAVHHHLIANGKRLQASIVVDTATAFSTHHVACLIGYGASAVCPYLALETCRQWAANPKVKQMMQRGKAPVTSRRGAQRNLKKALEKGVLKILSKMGICLLSSYSGAQIFEAYGLGPDVIDLGFRGTPSRIGGLTLDELEAEALNFWRTGYAPLDAGQEERKKLENFGFIQSRPGGEHHGNNPEMTKLLHKAVRGNEPEAFAYYSEYLKTRPTSVLRDLLEVAPKGAPIPLDQVEPVSAIMERFATGGMSLGAISRECHESIAIAMNRIGGKSNSGEGGEDPSRFIKLTDVDENGLSKTLPYVKGLKNGDTANSKIKQVASGRFGVTPSFLANAEQLEIKIAQGAKPGEGGQLPGTKVSPYIGGLRNSKPGVTLISPPPHHDIYSIEDLAQLIWDLHQVNAEAKVSVKLVAEVGIGTVASGVAKANADIIQVSGHDGGTGASPISSIKHAGGPWELGLIESHKALVQNELRDRVVLRVDGGFKSGVDIITAAALGADEYGFGSVAMIATGCIMARVCHTNNCPVGVASQREELRARFPGVPSDLVNFFQYVAEEVRITLASLGCKSLDEIIGRNDLLRPRKDVTLAKTAGLDLRFMTEPVKDTTTMTSTQRRKQPVHTNGFTLDEQMLQDAKLREAIASEGSYSSTQTIVNVDRCVGARIAYHIAKKYGENFAGQLDLTFNGSAGQSFGSFNTKGMNLRLVGEANDYVGKGMAGGEIVIVPSPKATFEASTATIIGNTCLYGATGGRMLVCGQAGERFAVRNSVADAVVEGTGDHCCEYMTGGCVVVLGKVGRNVAAGMTGGLAYFYDEAGTFPEKVNKEIVAMKRVETAAGEQQLKQLILAHVEKTGSAKGRFILDNWSTELGRFWQLVPPSEANSPEANPDFSAVLSSQQVS
eukprot:jgi/Mesvir1/604/Mv02039-RA.1